MSGSRRARNLLVAACVCLMTVGLLWVELRGRVRRHYRFVYYMDAAIGYRQSHQRLPSSQAELEDYWNTSERGLEYGRIPNGPAGCPSPLVSLRGDAQQVEQFTLRDPKRGGVFWLNRWAFTIRDDGQVKESVVWELPWLGAIHEPGW